MSESNRHETRSEIPWWRTPGALILWALLVAAIIVGIGRPSVREIIQLLGEAGW